MSGFSFGNPQPTATTTGGGGFSFSSGSGGGASKTSGGFSFGGGGSTGSSANPFATSTATMTTANNAGNLRGPSTSAFPSSTTTTSTASSTSPAVPSVRALAWDPTGTASLSLAPLPSPTTTSQQQPSQNATSVDLDVFLSHDGTGCPPHETECLLRCLDARDEWNVACKDRQSLARRRRLQRIGGIGGGGDGEEGGAEVTKLSMDYRAAMCECLMSLQRKVQDAAGNANGDGNNGMEEEEDGNEEEGNNLELLSLTYAISHLAEIFLLPSLALVGLISSYSSTLDGGFHDKPAAISRLDGPAGSLSADTVRYLRLHHSKGSFTDLPEVVAMLESDQPEYYQNSGSNSVVPGPYDYPYWNLLLQYVIQGELFKAWTLLTHHSACRHAEEEAASGEQQRELSPEAEGFAALRAILLSAPLPGGRGDGYCDDAGIDDYLDEEELERDEAEEEGRLGGSGDAEEDGVEDPGEIDELMIDGVPRNAYLLWEALPRRADRLRTLRYRRDLRLCGRGRDVDRMAAMLESPTVPELYQPRAALVAFRNWQETIRITAFPSGVNGGGAGGSMSALFRRFPPLAQIMSLLLGAVPPAIANDASLSWSESLLMELLYSRPDIMPDDIVTRANVAMSKSGGGGGENIAKGALQEIILSVMRGSAGQVVETMFSVCGGASGAALPATMTSLLCNLLVEAKCIPPQNDSSKVNIQTELLLLAAESILSSFSVQGQHAVGVRAAIRLLLPHAPPKRGPRPTSSTNANSSGEENNIIYEPRFSAMIAEALSHRLPATDAETRDLLQLCEDCIRLGSVPIADACESLAFSRATHHASAGNLTREAYWLLRGMEVQSCWLPKGRERTLGFASRRHFGSLCEKSAHSLIAALSMEAVSDLPGKGLSEEQKKTTALALKAAEDVLEGVLQDDVMAPVLKGHAPANLLQYAFDIALAHAKGDTVRMAADIVHCLEERCLSTEEDGGVVSTLADPKMYAELLGIAFGILAREDEESNGRPMEFAKCAFSLHGMHILMARLTQAGSWEGIITSSMPSKQPSNVRKEYFGAMQLEFCKGLMRVLSNQQSTLSNAAKKKESMEVSLDDEIELMLSPCI